MANSRPNHMSIVMSSEKLLNNLMKLLIKLQLTIISMLFDSMFGLIVN